MIASSTMNASLYSVRMRASDGILHLSGGERLVPRSDVAEVVAELTRKALSVDDSGAAEVHCTVEKVNPDDVRYATLPDIKPYQVKDYQQGRLLALSLLQLSGVSEDIAKKAVNLLVEGPGLNGNVMRGAVLIDVNSGDRLEDDRDRGVRVTRMDLTDGCRSKLSTALAAVGLGHRRVAEALVLAGKVAGAPGIVAELCWSDAPDYTVGYVSSSAGGYQRISALKQKGDPLGGRIFFVDPEKVKLSVLISYLEKTPVLFDNAGKLFPVVEVEGES